jgi:DNA-binding XRE family transcriptional regulator
MTRTAFAHKRGSSNGLFVIEYTHRWGGIIGSEMATANTTNIYRLLRIARDRKVKDLAEELGVTPAYINAIESGNRTPSPRVVRDYSEALGVDEELILNFSKENSDLSGFEKIMLRLLQTICRYDDNV